MFTTFRLFVNRAGIAFNDLKTDILYAEDLNLISNAINFIESRLSNFHNFSFYNLTLLAPVLNDPPVEFDLPYDTSFITHVWSLEGYIRLILPVIPKKYVIYTINNFGSYPIEVATFSYAVGSAPNICIISSGDSVTIYNNTLTYLVK